MVCLKKQIIEAIDKGRAPLRGSTLAHQVINTKVQHYLFRAISWGCNHELRKAVCLHAEKYVNKAISVYYMY